MLPKSGIGIIDVGTDHGLIPIRLATDGYKGRIIASDSSEGPLNTAVRNARQKSVSDRISFMISDGLDRCPIDEIDCILISGMGGDKICEILDRAEWIQTGCYQLILQPMTHAEVLRYWLVYNGFRIEEEALVYESRHCYQIIAAVPGENEKMSDAEFFVGQKGISRDGDNVSHLIQDQMKVIQKKISGLSGSMPDADSCRLLYEGIYRQLEEMLD